MNLESANKAAESWKDKLRSEKLKKGMDDLFKVAYDHEFYGAYQKKREYITSNLPVKEVIVNRVTKSKE